MSKISKLKASYSSHLSSVRKLRNFNMHNGGISSVWMGYFITEGVEGGYGYLVEEVFFCEERLFLLYVYYHIYVFGHGALRNTTGLFTASRALRSRAATRCVLTK